MINFVPFDNETNITGIWTGSNLEVLLDRGTEELTNPHRVDFYALILVTEGTGYHYIDNRLYHCRPGTLLILSPHQVHYFEEHFRWKGFVTTFQNSELFALDGAMLNDSMINLIRSTDILNDMMHLIGTEFEMLYEETRRDKDSVSGHIQRNLLQNILYKIFYRSGCHQINQPKSRELGDFQIFNDSVEKHFSQKHNASDYVDDTKISAKRLNTVCKKIKGLSAKQVIDARLLLEAKRLIGYTNIPISNIAYSLGFNEPTNLAKFFRKHTNISPTEFRNMSKPFTAKAS